jgi:hypothetical protein
METINQSPDQALGDAPAFLEMVRQRHERVNPCFMTGKGCIYTDQIDQALDERKKSDGACAGFMIMPFRPRWVRNERLMSLSSIIIQSHAVCPDCCRALLIVK